MDASVVVIGLGEIGRPLLDIVGRCHEATGVDLAPVDFSGECKVMHVCYPFDIPDFVAVTVNYIEKYQPRLTIINSTVAPGTTRKVQELTGAPIVHSPVRGKHAKMVDELLHYTKFIGSIDAEAGQDAAEHFKSLGMKTSILMSPEATEIAKLSETTYFGLLIVWAQEVERYCERYSLNYEEVVSFYEEIAYLPPVKFFPGVIGGHCIMPNVDILREEFGSPVLDAIVRSNGRKIEAVERTGETDT